METRSPIGSIPSRALLQLRLWRGWDSKDPRFSMRMAVAVDVTPPEAVRAKVIAVAAEVAEQAAFERHRPVRGAKLGLCTRRWGWYRGVCMPVPDKCAAWGHLACPVAMAQQSSVCAMGGQPATAETRVKGEKLGLPWARRSGVRGVLGTCARGCTYAEAGRQLSVDESGRAGP